MRARRLRVLRGSAATLVATIIAGAAHTLAGGGAPPAWLLAAVTIVAAPVAIALVGRRRSLPRLVAAVGAAQFLLHAAFAAVGTDAPATLHGHAHDLAALAVPATPAAAGMTLGHVLAAAVTVVLLATGERMLAACVRGIRRLLRLPGVPASVTVPRRVALGRPRVRRILLLTSVSRRGPPAFAR